MNPTCNHGVMEGMRCTFCPGGFAQVVKFAEHDQAIILANKILNRTNGDPDDDLAVLSRQLLRAHESREVVRGERDKARKELAWVLQLARPLMIIKCSDISDCWICRKCRTLFSEDESATLHKPDCSLAHALIETGMSKEKAFKFIW